MCSPMSMCIDMQAFVPSPASICLRAKPWILSLRGVLRYPATFQAFLVTPFVSIFCLCRRAYQLCRYSKGDTGTHLPCPKDPALDFFANLDLNLPIPGD